MKLEVGKQLQKRVQVQKKCEQVATNNAKKMRVKIGTSNQENSKSWCKEKWHIQPRKIASADAKNDVQPSKKSGTSIQEKS